MTEGYCDGCKRRAFLTSLHGPEKGARCAATSTPEIGTPTTDGGARWVASSSVRCRRASLWEVHHVVVQRTPFFRRRPEPSCHVQCFRNRTRAFTL